MAGESQQVPKSDPDPTVITTEIIAKEIRHLRELLESQIQATDAMCDEKFRSVELRLAQGESSRIEQKVDTQKAVDAALTAQKEAVREQTAASDKAISKSEEGTARAIAQLSTTFTTAIAGLASNFDDIKERVGKIENIAVGGSQERAEVRQNNSGTVALVGLAVSILVAVVIVLGFIAATRPP